MERRCGAVAAAEAISAAAKRGGDGADRDVAGQEAVVRRGIARAVRRGGADAHRGGVCGNHRQTRRPAARDRPPHHPLRHVQNGFHHPERARRSRLSSRDSCVPRSDAPVRRAAADREFHRRVHHRKIVGRLQLVSRQLPQPDSSEHGPADLHRPRRRSRVSRRLSGSSRVQRAAREASRSRSGLARVYGVCALLAAIAHRRRHGQLRHRGDVQPRRAHRVRTGRALSDGEHQRIASEGILRGDGTGGSAVIRG